MRSDVKEEEEYPQEEEEESGQMNESRRNGSCEERCPSSEPAQAQLEDPAFSEECCGLLRGAQTVAGGRVAVEELGAACHFSVVFVRTRVIPEQNQVARMSDDGDMPAASVGPLHFDSDRASLWTVQHALDLPLAFALHWHPIDGDDSVSRVDGA
eukprot:CAMPEP_0177690476 /NCGR_PEP_ID=MMETSP0484_2-20121128/786_1 /TAXON_ID=354590 /ORGANISM="Rhodomonas lens, Strain RHODO" /LENGTH=154 /DNA_ID=CAMNT_0019201021 /DNA_START=325 /DNA_END=789 /DNA_ORIENTATION=-